MSIIYHPKGSGMWCLSLSGMPKLQWNQRIVKPGIEGLHFLRRFQASCQSICKNPMIDQFDHHHFPIERPNNSLFLRAKIQVFLAKFMKNPQLTFPLQRFGRGWYRAGKAGISPKFSWWKSDKSYGILRFPLLQTQILEICPYLAQGSWWSHKLCIFLGSALTRSLAWFIQPCWLTRGSRNVQSPEQW